MDAELAAPLTPHSAAALLAVHWELAGCETAAVIEIGSYEDQNFEVRSGGGRFVLKAERRTAASVALEQRVLDRVAAALPDLELPVALVTRAGGFVHELPGPVQLRLLTWVSGRCLDTLPDLDDETLRALGALAGRVGITLADLDLPAASALGEIDAPADSKWDPRHARAVVASVLAEDPPPTPAETAALTAAVAPLTEAAATPTVAALPLRLVHGDITTHNTLAAADASLPTGLIDFGDVCRSWRIADLAAVCVDVACTRVRDPLEAISEVVAGHHAVAPLVETEADLLWPLILARAAACAALSVRQRRMSPDSAYVAAMEAGDWNGLHALLAVQVGLGAAQLRHVCGFSPRTIEPALSPAPIPVIESDGPPEVRDLGLTASDPSDVAPSAGRVALGRWGEIRLAPALAGGPADLPPATLHLGADVFCAAGTPVRAPLPGTVHGPSPSPGDDELWLTLAPGAAAAHLRLAHITPAVAPGDAVRAGDTVGHVRAHGRLHVQYAPAPGTPGLGSPRLRAAWLALCPDPSGLVGAEVRAPDPPDPALQRARRERVLAGAQELYYREPLQAVRGRGQYLYDGDGRPYLDMVNNVASVGHSHPRITAAATRQLSLLNTNSRFLYDSMTVYAERLSALLPDELDTVFLVNSGSEACDLALQIARTATGRHDIVALQGAYHGWTGSVYEACTSPADNPGWVETKPPWVHLAAQPDPYRGALADDARAYADSVARACAVAPPAAFISESMLGNQGAVELPNGYLAQAYAAVRGAGGICIADEIQVGCARTGETFWAFAHEGVVPDVVTIAKAAGNGHPIGAVVCHRQLADALGRRAAFFSSPGGGPVSCEIGIAVLDVIAEERLQENAAMVGGALRRSLIELAERHPAIGAVHGRGLYLGVDLVRDPATREPDRPRALAVCERLRRLGIVVLPTGDHGNVLKVKPPLCLTAADADRFTAMLDRALADVAAWL